MTRGAMECAEYRWLGCGRPRNQDVAGLDCVAGGNCVKLEPSAPVICTPGGAVHRVTKQVTIHSLVVPRDCAEPVVSLHVDSYVVFDVARGRCRRRDLRFDTVPEGHGSAAR